MNLLGRIFRKKEVVDLGLEKDRAKEIALALYVGGNPDPTESDQKRLEIDMDDWGIGFGHPFDWSKLDDL
jgi:hypothetical protein